MSEREPTTRHVGVRVPIDLALAIDEIVQREDRPITRVVVELMRRGLAERQRSARLPLESE